MIRKRIYRDLGILAVFLGAFYAVVTFVGRLDAVPENADINVSQMSAARLRADLAREQADAEKLIDNLQQMVEVDPYNGYAWYQLGNVWFAQLFDVEYDDVEVEREFGGVVKFIETEPESGNAEFAETKKLRQQLQRQATDAYLQAMRFARYRGPAMLQLARITSLQGDTDQALDWLRRYFQKGYVPPGGLRSYIEFRKLRSDPRSHSLFQQDDEFWWSRRR